MDKCPFCGALTFSKITQQSGISYALTELDQNVTPPHFKPETGIPIIISGCTTCKKIQLECPLL